MTDQEKINELVEQLQRLGKMPSFTREGIDDDLFLSALVGAAFAGVLMNHGYMIVRSGKTDSGESDEEGNIIWSEWCWELYEHSWGNGDDYHGAFDSYPEAQIAALKRIEGGEQMPLHR